MPDEAILHVGIAFLDSAIDDLLQARLTLTPSVRGWDAPTGALGSALGDDVEAARARRHLLEIEERLRELAPALNGHLDEWRRELFQFELRCAAVGWLVGVELACRRAPEA